MDKLNKKSIRTDLALESLDFASSNTIDAITKKVEHINGVLTTTVRLDKDFSQSEIGKPKGIYITCEIQNLKSGVHNPDSVIELIAGKIKSLLDEAGDVLVVGLGNQSITPDTVGTQTVKGIFATRHIEKSLASSLGLPPLRKVSAVAPGVLGQTGIETAEIIKSICNHIKPQCVIVIDALASRSIDRLGTTIQISNTGISPGSGVSNHRHRLDKDSLGAQVISVGVPTVVDVATVAFDLARSDNFTLPDSAHGMMVTPREIDTLIAHSSKILADAINFALQPTLSLEELRALTA